MAAITITDVKNFLHVDYSTDDALITGLMSAADSYLKGAIGATYDNADERAKTLSLIVISDLYDNRGVTEKASGNVRRIVEDFALQMRLELRTEVVT
jgi:uncharacterized phage protein (predicted DNA packaging)